MSSVYGYTVFIGVGMLARRMKAVVKESIDAY
mgnify:CR=1 FL=1